MVLVKDVIRKGLISFISRKEPQCAVLHIFYPVHNLRSKDPTFQSESVATENLLT